MFSYKILAVCGPRGQGQIREIRMHRCEDGGIRVELRDTFVRGPLVQVFQRGWVLLGLPLRSDMPGEGILLQ